MRRYASPLLNVLVVLGLTLPSGLEAAPVPARSKEARLATATVRSEVGGGPVRLSKQAKTPQDRRHHRRQDAGRKVAKGRKHAERKNDDKQKNRKKDGTQDRSERQHQAVQLPSGRLPAAETVAPVPGRPPTAEDRYIVFLADGTSDVMRSATDIAMDSAGVVPTHVYENVFDGFAAVIPDEKLDDVRSDPRVKAVVSDGIIHAYDQDLPTGVDRIDADLNPTARINRVDGPDGSDERVDVDVAVLDSAGINDHPDINGWAWANCTDDRNRNADDDGHGTHVGGTIGAFDNGIGVVGVAPGARIWNVRVLKAQPGGASGLTSWVICGLDFVTAHATDPGDGRGDIEVANLSLGGPGSDSNCQTDLVDHFHRAICRTVAAGVMVVVAAGNGAGDASTRTPAAYDEVITVSALADSDGQPGGLGPATLRGADDSLASFSNFGGDVDIAAPGVGIRSTYLSGGYQTLNGTSMAAPHVAGAAALYLAKNPGATPAQVKAALLSTREAIALPHDPDGINEGVLNVSDPGPPPPPVTPPPPTPVVKTPPTGDSGVQSPPKRDTKKHKKKSKRGSGKKGKGKKK